MTPRVPRPAPVKNQMGKQLTHVFNRCGHTVEGDKCVPPPKRLMKMTKMQASTDNQIVWDLYCMDCDWKFTVEQAVCKLMKEQIAIMEEIRLPGAKIDEMKIAVKRDTPHKDKRGNIIRILTYVRAATADGKLVWRPYSFIARPARSLDGEVSHQWQAYLAEAKSGPDSKWRLYGKVCAIKFEISEIIEAFERKWNEDGSGDDQDGASTPSTKPEDIDYFDPTETDDNYDAVDELIALCVDA